ncbi:MAG TPA: MFS transporter [Chloroflexi bacterium]|nr:MFS transporter [Chloroflexota bacterium]
MKLDWKKTFLIGFGFFGISVMWQLYDSFVPIFLQSGRPDFVSSRNVLGFGLTATLTGAIMGIDNLVAIFILPLIGMWSDHVRTRIGRRYPFIITAAPVGALAFVLMPIASGLINPEANGSVADNMPAFILFMTGAGLMLLAMAVLRTPVITLMPDLTPSPLRSKANGVINLMGGVGVVISSFIIARLFDLNPVLPFVTGSAVLLIAIVLLFVSVKEPDVESLPHSEEHEASEEEEALRALKGLRVVPREHRRSLGFLLLAIFAWFIGYNGVSTFFTSYAVNVLHVSEGLAPTLFGIAGVTFILFAIPAGFIGERFGRRRTISVGLAIFGVLLVVGYFTTNPTVIGAVLGVGGLAWALVNINSLPMVVDTTNDARLLGTYTGLYYLASQTASTAAPAITGAFVDLTGGNFRVIFLSGPLFFLLAILCMQFVTRGEAHAVESVPVTAD